MRRLCTTAAALALLAAPAAEAERTEITVRVLSRDAKFIGSSMGGARITLRDADTGELLAQGVTAGSTGDTGRLMNAPRTRGGELATEGAARFDAVLDLEAPVKLEIAAFGPLAQLQSAVEASTTLWVLPGKHLTGGDGVVLELTGFVVDVLAPPAHARLGGEEVEVRVNLTML